METLQDIERRLGSANSLGDIVNAMRSQSAVYLMNAEKALSPIRSWQTRVGQALAQVAGMIPRLEAPRHRPGKTGFVVFSGDQGLCGNYNEKVVDFALEQVRTDGSGGPIFAVGRRGADMLERKGFAPREVISAPSVFESSGPGVQDLAEAVLGAFWKEKLSRVLLCHPVHESVQKTRMEARQVLPLDVAAIAAAHEPMFRSAPRIQVDVEKLVESLATEYFFILFRAAAVESFASENAARMTAMESAQRNVEDRIELLTSARNRMRQETITAEVLETATGAAAVIEGGH